jgi:hypothetical protein
LELESGTSTASAGVVVDVHVVELLVQLLLIVIGLLTHVALIGFESVKGGEMKRD